MGTKRARSVGPLVFPRRPAFDGARTPVVRRVVVVVPAPNQKSQAQQQQYRKNIWDVGKAAFLDPNSDYFNQKWGKKLENGLNIGNRGRES